MRKTYPFPSGSEVTASYAVTASHAISASLATTVSTASVADVVLYPQSGSYPSVNLCFITFSEYQQILSGSKVEQCIL